MNKKKVILACMMLVIAVLLVVNLSVFKGEEEKALQVNDETQHMLNDEMETESESVISKVEELSSQEPVESEYFGFSIVVLTEEEASSAMAEWGSMSSESVIFVAPGYYEEYKEKVGMP